MSKDAFLFYVWITTMGVYFKPETPEISDWNLNEKFLIIIIRIFSILMLSVGFNGLQVAMKEKKNKKINKSIETDVSIFKT